MVMDGLFDTAIDMHHFPDAGCMELEPQSHPIRSNRGLVFRLVIHQVNGTSVPLPTTPVRCPQTQAALLHAIASRDQYEPTAPTHGNHTCLQGRCRNVKM